MKESNIDKNELHNVISKELERIKVVAFESAQTAHKHATDKENIPDNKYDTLALEEAYLAYGQTQRVLECEENIQVFSNLKVRSFFQDDEIKLGALIELEEKSNKNTKMYFISPCSGGVKINFNINNQKTEITLITSTAPLGKLLIGKYEDDEIELKSGLNNETKTFEIKSVV